MRWTFALLVSSLLPLAARAEVGTVTELDGAATRTPKDGAPLALAVGSPIELEDTVTVMQGNVAITLTDSSVIALQQGSQLRVDEAQFEDLERKGVSLRLLAGAVWAKVAKVLAGSDAKFEVATDRAVAGVRGTEFQVELTPDGDEPIQVAVEEGDVDVARLEPVEAIQEAGKPLPVERYRRLPPEHVHAGFAWAFRRSGPPVVRNHVWRPAPLRAFVLQHRPRWKEAALRHFERRQQMLKLRQQRLNAGGVRPAPAGLPPPHPKAPPGVKRMEREEKPRHGGRRE